jgi:uncharacterized protein (TIGR02147 family)
MMPGKPDVYKYRQAHFYLADLFGWYKKKGQSMRGLAKKLNVSVALLSLVAKGKRPLTEENIDIWAPTFKWNSQEISWLKQLVLLEHSSVDAKKVAMESLAKFKTYNENSPDEVLTFKYLKKWWNVAIREMSELKDFKEDENWIQEQLIFKVPIIEIRKSLNFLNKHKLLAKYGDFRRLNCQGNIYKLSLSTFHEQMLDNAVKAIYKVNSEDRYILGQTLAIDGCNFQEAKKILEEALEKVVLLGKNEKNSNGVYHFSFLGFPVTLGNKDKI